MMQAIIKTLCKKPMSLEWGCKDEDIPYNRLAVKRKH